MADPPSVTPAPPRADFALPWDDPSAPDPAISTTRPTWSSPDGPRFPRSAVARTVWRLFDGFELTPGLRTLRSLPGQIGGVGRAAEPCPVHYRRRSAVTPT